MFNRKENTPKVFMAEIRTNVLLEPPYNKPDIQAAPANPVRYYI
jgi:hypothetical protein